MLRRFRSVKGHPKHNHRSQREPQPIFTVCTPECLLVIKEFPCLWVLCCLAWCCRGLGCCGGGGCCGAVVGAGGCARGVSGEGENLRHGQRFGCERSEEKLCDSRRTWLGVRSQRREAQRGFLQAHCERNHQLVAIPRFSLLHTVGQRRKRKKMTVPDNWSVD